MIQRNSIYLKSILTLLMSLLSLLKFTFEFNSSLLNALLLISLKKIILNPNFCLEVYFYL